MLEEAIDGRIELVLPSVVLDEVRRVTTAKLGFSASRARDACRLLERLASARPGPPKQVDPVTGDRDDDAILACAVEAGTDVLVTGDRKHLLPLGEHRGVRLLTPQALLAQLRQRPGE